MARPTPWRVFTQKGSSRDTSGSSEVVSKGSGKFKGKTTVTESYQGLEDGKGTGKFGDTAKGKTDTTKGSHKGSSGDSVGPKGSGMFKGNSDVTENNQGLEDGKGKGKFGDTMKGKTDTMKGSHPKGSSGDSVGPKGSGMFKGNSDVTENNQGLEDGKGKGKFGDTMKGKTDAMKGSHPKGSSGSSEVVSKGSGKFKGNSDVTEIDQGFEDGKGKGKFGDTTKGKTDTMKGYRKGSGDDTSGLTNGVSKGSGKFKGKTTVTESYQGFVDGKGKGKFGDTKGKTDNTKGSHKGSSGDDTSGSADVVSKGSVKGNSDVTENNQGLEDGKGKGKFGDTMKGKTDTMKGSHKGSSGDSVGPKGSGMFKGNSDVTENNQGLEDGKGKGKFGDTMKGKTDTMKGSHPKGSSGDSVGPKGSGMFKGNSDVTENNQGLEDGKGKGKFGDTMKGKTDTTKGYRKGSSGENISGSSEVVSKGAGKFKGKPTVTENNQGLEDGKGKGKFGDTTKGKTDTTKGSHKGSGDDTSGSTVAPKGAGKPKGKTDVTETNQRFVGKGIGDTETGKSDTWEGSHPEGATKGSGKYTGKPLEEDCTHPIHKGLGSYSLQTYMYVKLDPSTFFFFWCHILKLEIYSYTIYVIFIYIYIFYLFNGAGFWLFDAHHIIVCTFIDFQNSRCCWNVWYSPIKTCVPICILGPIKAPIYVPMLSNRMVLQLCGISRCLPWPVAMVPWPQINGGNLQR